MSLTADIIENEIRDMLKDCLVKQSKKDNIPLNMVQLRFSPELQGENEISCKYEMLNDYIVYKELSFIDIAGVFKLPFKGVVEAYIVQLYEMINEREGVDIQDIRIIIQATASNPSNQDLIAHLFNKGKLIRELKVAEFVSGAEEQTEETKQIQNETND